MSISGIQGQLLEVTVVACSKLKDTEWISRQDPYVCLEYASTKYRTRTCTDGGKNPTFQEKFVFNLIEGLRELGVVVWNSNTLKRDDFIGSGKVQLQKVLSQGFDDSTWSLQSKTGRHAGEVRLIMHFANANKHGTGHAASAPPYGMPTPPLYSTPPPSVSPYPPATTYPSAPYPSHPAYPTAYPQAQHSQPQSGAYPPPPYGAPSAYPPQSYPPPQQPSSHYPPGPYPGTYPPRPY